MKDSSASRKPGLYYDQQRPELVALLPGKLGRVLDVGCGVGRRRSCAPRPGDTLAGIEVDEEAAPAARRDLRRGPRRGRRRRGWTDARRAVRHDPRVRRPRAPVRTRTIGPAPPHDRSRRRAALLHVSVPNARHCRSCAISSCAARSATPNGEHRDSTHLRWFTRRDLVAAARGRRLARRAARRTRRSRGPGRLAERLTRRAERGVPRLSVVGACARASVRCCAEVRTAAGRPRASASWRAWRPSASPKETRRELDGARSDGRRQPARGRVAVRGSGPTRAARAGARASTGQSRAAICRRRREAAGADSVPREDVAAAERLEPALRRRRGAERLAVLVQRARIGSRGRSRWPASRRRSARSTSSQYAKNVSSKPPDVPERLGAVGGGTAAGPDRARGARRAPRRDGSRADPTTGASCRARCPAVSTSSGRIVLQEDAGDHADLSSASGSSRRSRNSGSQTTSLLTRTTTSVSTAATPRLTARPKPTFAGSRTSANVRKPLRQQLGRAVRRGVVDDDDVVLDGLALEALERLREQPRAR